MRVPKIIRGITIALIVSRKKLSFQSEEGRMAIAIVRIMKLGKIAGKVRKLLILDFQIGSPYNSAITTPQRILST